MAETTYASSSRKSDFREGSERSNSGQMQGLLNEFRGVYERKLRKLDDAEKAGENMEKV